MHIVLNILLITQSLKLRPVTKVWCHLCIQFIQATGDMVQLSIIEDIVILNNYLVINSEVI